MKSYVRHGHTYSPTYEAWRSMKGRCLRPKSGGYALYGGRGIRVCERWLGPKGFLNFLADMGERPEGASLDRIDVNGNYEPANCRWASVEVQSNNTRRNRRISANGETMTIAQWARRLGVHPTTISHRLAKGWDEVAAVTMGRCA